MNNIDIFLSSLFLLSTLCSLQIILKQYREYLNKKFKYKFYSLRDQLTMLVLKEDLNEQDLQYTSLRDAINYSIYASDNMSISEHLRALMTKQNSEKKIIKFTNDTAREIALSYYVNTIDLVRKNSWFEIKIFQLVFYISNKSRNFKNIAKHTPFSHRNPLKEPIKILEKLENSKKQLQTA